MEVGNSYGKILVEFDQLKMQLTYNFVIIEKYIIQSEECYKTTKQLKEKQENEHLCIYYTD